MIETMLKSARVLIVEDNPEIVALLVTVLQGHNVETRTASSGAEALAMLETESVDLIVLDLGLPDVDGLQVCRRIKKSVSQQSIPIIVMTGAESVEQKVEAFELGAVDYVNKPFNLAEFEARILAQLRHKTSRDQADAAHHIEQRRTLDDLNRISKAMDSTSDAVCLLDGNGCARFINYAFQELFQTTLESLSDPECIRPFLKRPDTWSSIWNSCRAGTPWSGELEVLQIGGEVLSTLCRADSLSGDETHSSGAVMIFTDISQRKRLERDLLFLANYDPLTGLFNRRYFDEFLETAVVQAKKGCFSHLLYLDLDNFKVINDSEGHAAGDKLLVEISKILISNVGGADKLGRFGGDEFTVLLTGSNQSEAVSIAKKLLAILDDFRFVTTVRSFATSASIGMSLIDGQFSAEDVLAQADSACYLAKAKGRNGLELFKADSNDAQRLSREAGWSILIKDALKDDRFELWLQPIKSLRKHSSLYFESLLRMRDREGNLILPAAFLPAAERFGNMQNLDQMVVQKAIDLLKVHSRLSLSINLSAKTLNDPGLPEFVEDRFKAAGVNPSRASFEITETDMIQNLAHARELMLRIRSLGCRFALDDFGCGASSLGYLRDLPVDFLKIDGSFIQSIATDPINRALVKSINEVAHALGKQTVAEYVVNAEVLRVVQELGIDYVQGYHICAPAPPSAFFPQTRGLD